MINETNFIVRASGRRSNSFYIDYSGAYKIIEIAKVAGLEPTAIKEIYQNNGADYDDSQDVYYFGSLDAAKRAVSDILGTMKAEQKGRLVYLSEAEVEYIRKALINEGSNTIHLKSRIKDAIFKKLNG